MRGYGWNGGGGGEWAAMGLVTMVFWVAVTAAVIAFVHHSRQPHNDRTLPGSTQSQAQRLLDERFARGDIDAEEYTHRHDLLKR